MDTTELFRGCGTRSLSMEDEDLLGLIGETSKYRQAGNSGIAIWSMNCVKGKDREQEYF